MGERLPLNGCLVEGNPVWYWIGTERSRLVPSAEDHIGRAGRAGWGRWIAHPTGRSRTSRVEFNGVSPRRMGGCRVPLKRQSQRRNRDSTAVSPRGLRPLSGEVLFKMVMTMVMTIA